ncbi:hypothetical protein CDAR_91111 [Caerostris darwini]|uniref:Uncharacterized protein n=1 Tax=Caerostris darwini TaxID=1538125 RepID=A0AAV4Q7K3_9ARAC|nr:hypothetical protein CDAR_91111 [Caerostris darwini]
MKLKRLKMETLIKRHYLSTSTAIPDMTAKILRKARQHSISRLHLNEAETPQNGNIDQATLSFHINCNPRQQGGNLMARHCLFRRYLSTHQHLLQNSFKSQTDYPVANASFK